MKEDMLGGGRLPAQTRGPREHYVGYIKRKRVVIAVMFVVVTGIALASLGMGSLGLSPQEIVCAVFGQGDARAVAAVQNIRLPRIATAVIAGIALSLAGCAYQSVLRNPLASASTLGISQGAAFGASLAIIVFAAAGASSAYEGVASGNPILTVLFAFIGAMASTVVILMLSRVREMTPESIVLLGVALSAVFTAGTTMVQYFAEDTQVAAVVFWTFGDLSRVSKEQLAIMSFVTLLSAVFFYINRWSLNAIETGEGLAHSLGVSVNKVRLSNMLVASAVASTVIAFCGIINFVGLVAPHIMRRLLGADYRFLLPASAIAGAGLLLLSDILCHAIVSPLILPISAITSLVGAPVFIYLLFNGVSR